MHVSEAKHVRGKGLGWIVCGFDLCFPGSLIVLDAEIEARVRVTIRMGLDVDLEGKRGMDVDLEGKGGGSMRKR